MPDNNITPLEATLSNTLRLLSDLLVFLNSLDLNPEQKAELQKMSRDNKLNIELLNPSTQSHSETPSSNFHMHRRIIYNNGGRDSSGRDSSR